MVDMKTLVDLQITIFLLMMAGYVMTKIKLLNEDSRKTLSNLLINFILPCNIIVSFMMDFNRKILLDGLLILIISTCIQIVLTLTARFFYPGTEPGRLAVLKYGTIVSNAGFLGNPITQGLYGNQGLLYASIYLVPQRIVMWSAGVTCFTGKKGKNVIRKILTHPCIVAVVLGLILMITQLQLPVGLEKTIRSAGNCNTAISMIVIGNILAGVKPSEIIDRDNIKFCVIRLFVIPLLVLAALRLFHVHGLVTNVSVVLAGMPAAATTAILAAKYDGDAGFAAKIVFLSTILSLGSIPILCLIM